MKRLLLLLILPLVGGIIASSSTLADTRTRLQWPGDVPQAYELTWNVVTDPDGRLLPNAVAPVSAWRPVAQGYPQAVKALALGESQVLLWTGAALEVWQAGEGDAAGSWKLLATTGITATGELSPTVTYTLFLNGRRAVAAGEGAPSYCFADGQLVDCDAKAEMDAPSDVWVADDGRWLYAQDGSIYDVGWVQAQGTASQYLTVWTDLAVEAGGPYTVTVHTVHTATGVAMRQSNDAPALYPLGLREPISVAYEGVAPAHIYLYRQAQRLPLVEAGSRITDDGQMLVAWETPEGIFVPAGYSLATEPIRLEVDGATKVTRICAVWSNAGSLALVLTGMDGQVLGNANLSAERPCNLVLGKVNRPFAVSVAGEALIFRLEAHVAY